MRIRMIKLAAGPGGVLLPGAVVDHLPQEDALRLLADQAAVAIDPPQVAPRRTATKPKGESRNATEANKNKRAGRRPAVDR